MRPGRHSETSYEERLARARLRGLSTLPRVEEPERPAAPHPVPRVQGRVRRTLS